MANLQTSRTRSICKTNYLHMQMSLLPSRSLGQLVGAVVGGECGWASQFLQLRPGAPGVNESPRGE